MILKVQANINEGKHRVKLVSRLEVLEVPIAPQSYLPRNVIMGQQEKLSSPHIFILMPFIPLISSQ